MLTTMLRLTALSTLMLGVASGHAAVVNYVQAPEGRIDLHEDRGECKGEAKHAEFVPPKGEPVPGCWVVKGPFVAVVFLDGDIAAIPVAELKKAEAA